jgi:vacuolar-type H+-ATPase subunit F/Vma7
MTDTVKTLAVIGHREAVRPYAFLGAAIIITDNADEARNALVAFAEAGHPVILITDDLLRAVSDTAERIMAQTGTAVTALPDKDGALSFSITQTRDRMFRAIGFNPG